MKKSLEDLLHEYAAAGELVHLSLVSKDGKFYANFAAASPANGYSHAHDDDPVRAILKAFEGSKAKRKRSPAYTASDEAWAKESGVIRDSDTVTVTPGPAPTNWVGGETA